MPNTEARELAVNLGNRGRFDELKTGVQETRVADQDRAVDLSQAPPSQLLAEVSSQESAVDQTTCGHLESCVLWRPGLRPDGPDSPGVGRPWGPIKTSSDGQCSSNLREKVGTIVVDGQELSRRVKNGNQDHRLEEGES